MKKICVKNGRVVDPANGRDGVMDVLIENGRISRVGGTIDCAGSEITDASGKIVIPGLVDMHVHLREPGREDKETVASGTLAALKGGVTTVCAMPNTIPPMDSERNVEMLKGIIGRQARCDVAIAGTITRGREGRELSDFAALKKCGVAAVTDDGSSVDSHELMSEAFKKAREHMLLVICHCEDSALAARGVINLGIMSTKLGLRGISNESEYARVRRDIELAGRAKCPVHIAHVSCAQSVEIIGKAKRAGMAVTSETAPHYFSLSEEATQEYNTNMKMNPPLRSRADREAVRAGLSSGVIDAIASDHAPHTVNEKDIEFELAEFGVIGLETSLAAAITHLIEPNILDWPALVTRMALNPARILGLDAGTLTEGRPADIVIVNPHEAWKVEKNDFVSMSHNSPFIGHSLRGIVEATIFAGNIAYRRTS